MNLSRPAVVRLLAASCLLALGGGIRDAAAAQLQAASDPAQIVGGERNYGDPAVAFLVVYGSAGEQSVCTGSLVASRWILTAAHCVSSGNLGFEPAAIEVYFGTEYTQDDPGFEFITEADGYAYHESYDPQVFGNHDIAMLHLYQDVPLTPMPLMSRSIGDADVGASLRLIGWGLTTGGAADSGIKRHAVSSLYEYDDLLVQVGGPGSNTCSGDSGGPSVMAMSGTEVIVGVTSFGDVECAQVGVSVRVDAYLDWIEQVTEGEVVAGSPPPAGGGDPGTPSPSPSPSPGAGCQSDADCGGGFCVFDGQASMCVDACASAADCPTGWDCLATDQPELSVCWPAEDPTPQPQDPGTGSGPAQIPGDDDADTDEDEDLEADDADDGTGCTVGGQAPPALSLLGLLVLAFDRRRRGPIGAR